MRSKCYAYIRVSTLKQGEKGSSLQEQRGAIEAYAQRLDIEIVSWFEEKETAAKRGRPKFNQLVLLLRKQQGIGVVIHKIDRSARNLKDWADLGELIDAGIEVHFAHESLDLKSRGGRLAADIQAVVAADFIRNLRDEVRKGINGRLKQGLFPNKAPIGYLDTGKGQVKQIDHVRAPFISKAFELYASGNFNLEQLRDRLFDLGLRNGSGNKVHKSGLSGVLNNPFYTGRIFVRRTGESFAGVHAPIITAGLYAAVQARLSGRKKNAGLRRRYHYQKMLRCHSCHGTLVPELQKGKYVYYRCHSLGCPTKCIREELVTSQIAAQLSSLEVKPSDLEQLSLLVGDLRQRRLAYQSIQVRGIKLELGKVDERLMKLTDLLLDGAIDKDAYNLKRRNLLDERLRMQGQIQAFEAGKDAHLERAQNLIELIRALHDNKFLEEASLIAVFAKNVISNFSIFQKQLVPHWAFPLSEMIPGDVVLHGAPSHPTSRTLDLTKVIKNLGAME
jgi:site-specific DNA recombinase